jgi:hypothetical protein
MRSIVAGVLCVIACVVPAVCAEGAPEAKSVQEGQLTGVLDVGCAFTSDWRFMAPALAGDVFGPGGNPKPILYQGEMAPRGMLILRRPGDPETTPKELHRIIRSKDHDITSCLQLVGAQYRSGPGAPTVRVPAEKLPKLKVRYAPEMPAEIAFPGAQTCVLLYEIGEGKKDEWPEGYWSVSLRLDVGALRMRIERQDTLSVADPARPEGTAVIYVMEFDAKAVRTKEDRENLLYFGYLNRLRSGDLAIRKTAIEPLRELVKAYPRHGELLLQQAKLFAEGEQYSEAAASAKEIVKYAAEGTLQAWFVAGLEERMSREEALQWLQREIAFWEQKAKERKEGE